MFPTEPDGDPLTVDAVTQPGHGAALIDADGTLTYTPAANYNGADSFTYTVSDGHSSDTGTLRITIAGVNDAPVANPDTGTTGENMILLVNVLANDHDVDDIALTATLGTPPKLGTVTLATDGGYHYQPHRNANGLFATHAMKFAFLQNAQQLGLR